jgi:hypothetical protein
MLSFEVLSVLAILMQFFSPPRSREEGGISPQKSFGAKAPSGQKHVDENCPAGKTLCSVVYFFG